MDYQGYDINMSDFTKISKEARDRIESDKIVRCWIKSGCLPCSHESDMEQMYDRVSSKGKDEGASDVSKLFRYFNIVPGDESLALKFGDEFEDWVDVESSPECRLAII